MEERMDTEAVLHDRQKIKCCGANRIEKWQEIIDG
jgi:hypothetical protein